MKTKQMIVGLVMEVSVYGALLVFSYNFVNMATTRIIGLFAIADIMATLYVTYKQYLQNRINKGEDYGY